VDFEATYAEACLRSDYGFLNEDQPFKRRHRAVCFLVEVATLCLQGSHSGRRASGQAVRLAAEKGRTAAPFPRLKRPFETTKVLSGTHHPERGRTWPRGLDCVLIELREALFCRSPVGQVGRRFSTSRR